MKNRSAFPISRLERSPFYPSALLAALAVALSMPGCKKEEAAAPDPNAIREGYVRITATITAPGIEPTDVYRVVGNFWKPNHYNIASDLHIMKKQPDGTYRFDFSQAELVDDFNNLNFFISRNGKFGELDTNCTVRHRDRSINFKMNANKEVKVSVVGFKGTGGCPP